MSEKLIFADTVRIKGNDIEFESPNPIGLDNVPVDFISTGIVPGLQLTKSRRGFSQGCNVTGALVANAWMSVIVYFGINDLNFLQLNNINPGPMTAASTLTVVGALPSRYRINTATWVVYQTISVNGTLTPSQFTILANGDIEINKNGGNFAIGDNVVIQPNTIIYVGST